MNGPCSSVLDVANQRSVITTIRPHFQPIVMSSTHEIYGFEALLRIPGVSSIEHLFKRWEATGEVAMIDVVMAQRVRSAILEQGGEPTVTINASALTIAIAADRYLLEVAALAQVAGKVIVELTETFPGLDLDALAYFANRCKQLDVDIAIDDCTPGYEFCQPKVLQRVRPAILKLDGSLVNDCHRSGDSRPISAILDCAESIKAKVVAEHIATRELRDWVVALGAHFLQGFYFGAAAPATGMKAYVTRPPEFCN